MSHYVTAAVGVLFVSIVYLTASSFLANRYHARKARELGCQPAWERPHRLPLGIDLVREVMQADKDQVVPPYFLNLYQQLGKPTWLQNFLGTKVYVTADPKNIQAVLATQFNDFEIGEMRRKNFFPLFGNGIFTTDGKAWYV
jgi:hypothetical protein